MVDKLKVHCIEANSYEESHKELKNEDAPLPFSVLQFSAWHKPTFSLPLQEIDVSLGINLLEPGVLDPGSQIVVIQHDLARELRAHINTGCVTTFPPFLPYMPIIDYLMSSRSHSRFVSHVTFLSTVTLLFIATCRRGSLHPYLGP